MTNREDIIDGLLVLEYRSGKQSAMAVLVKRWHPRLCKQAYHYTLNRQQAQDIAQDSWGKILSRLGGLQDPNRFGVWALKIVSRRALDYLRKQKRERNRKQSYIDDHRQNVQIVGDDNPNRKVAVMEILREAIKNLPPKQHLTLNLFYLEGYTIDQIGEILGIKKGTVKSRLFTAREHVKTIIKNTNYEK